MPRYLFEYKGHRVHVQVHAPFEGASWAGEIVITSREDEADVERRYTPQVGSAPQNERMAADALSAIAKRIIDEGFAVKIVGNG